MKKELFVVLIKWLIVWIGIYKQKPVERLIEYVKCNNIRDETIANLITELVKSNGIVISCCRFQTYDVAGKTVGKQKRVAQNFQIKLRMLEHYTIIVLLTNKTLP